MRLPARIGLVGCGAVSHQYFPNLLHLPQVTVSAVADVDSVAADKLAGQYGVPAVEVDALLNSPDVDIVLNLTPIAFHVQVTRAALAAGKHVYSEKSLATTADEAKELLAIAEANDLIIGCAPDTLLGTGFQAARRELEAGAIGRPLTALAAMFRSRVPRSAYFEGFNALFDMAPYYLSALVTLFGPADAVSGYIEYDPEAPQDIGFGVGISSVIEFASGMAATLTMNWGSAHRREVPVLDVYAESGVLRFSNPNNFGDPSFIRQHDEPDGDWREIPGSRQPAEWSSNLRGLGVAEMADAVSTGRRPRADGTLACHVVDVIESLIRSSTSGQRAILSTTCQPPEPVSDDDRNSYLNPERSTA
jgi:predicted dehydrogenase